MIGPGLEGQIIVAGKTVSRHVRLACLQAGRMNPSITPCLPRLGTSLTVVLEQ